LAVGLLLWGINEIITWNSSRRFRIIRDSYKEESIPGVREIHYRNDNWGPLELDDNGFDLVRIGFIGVQGTGLITWRKEDYSVKLKCYTATPAHEIISEFNPDLYVGDEIEFGGYRIVVRDLVFLDGHAIVFLKVSPLEVP